jgi:site-specific recombinase XerD
MTTPAPIRQSVSIWNESIKAWCEWLIAGGLARGTVDLRRYQLIRFGQDHGRRTTWDLSPADLGSWMAGHGWGLESLRSYRSALRSFYGWAHASGYVSQDPARLLRPLKRTRPRARPAPEDVIDSALQRADPRGWLLLMLGSREGLRRGEMAVIHRDRDLLRTRSGWSLIVHGKGSKDRIVPLRAEVAMAILATPPGWLFPNGHGGHLTPGHVSVLLRRALGTATAHQLRHRFGTVTYRRTHDLRAVQELLGHASVATTQLYIAVDDDELRRVMEAAA